MPSTVLPILKKLSESARYTVRRSYKSTPCSSMCFTQSATKIGKSSSALFSLTSAQCFLVQSTGTFELNGFLIIMWEFHWSRIKTNARLNGRAPRLNLILIGRYFTSCSWMLEGCFHCKKEAQRSQWKVERNERIKVQENGFLYLKDWWLKKKKTIKPIYSSKWNIIQLYQMLI